MLKHSYDIIAGILIGLVLLLLYYFSALAISENVLPKTYEYAFNLAITVIGAFSGAWFAFRLQNLKAKKDTDAQNVNAANNAIFELARWYNKLHAFKTQFIDEHRTNAMRHLYIMPAAGMAFGKPEIDYDSLSFLFKSTDPNILGTVSLTEQEIASTIDVILQRSEIHVEALQPAVEQVEKRLGQSFPPSELEKELGVRNTQVLKMLTDYLVKGVDASIAALRENIDKLKAESQSMYPDHVIIGMIDPPSVSSNSAESL
jgi:uncharacterized small protein (DUF1192 family)